MHIFSRMALATLAGGVAIPAIAQGQDIIVTGSGLARPAGEAAYDTVIIDRAQLAGSASGRLEDILRDAAGFQQFRRSDARSAHPTSQGATLRGLGGNASSRALVVLDGVPQTDPFGGWVSWAAYRPMRLGLIRVTRGGGSGAQGPGALAGTIELFSAGPQELGPAWGGIAYGSRDSVEADIGLSANLAGGFATIAAGYARGDGFIPIVAEDRGPADRPAFYEQASLAMRAVAPIGQDTELQAGGMVLLDRRDRGTAFTDSRNIGADASLRLIGRGRWGWEALAWLQMRDFASRFASVNPARTLATQTLDQYAVPATGLGARLEVRPPIGTGIELRLGVDARATSGRTQERYSFVAGSPTRLRDAGGRTRTTGAFAEASVDAGERLTLTGGARIDRWWISEGELRETLIAGGAPLTDTAFADRSGWEPTLRGGATFRPARALTLRAAAYSGWRLPTLNELYRPFRAGTDATAANATLRPERLRGVDAGVDYAPLPGIRLGATLFHNRLTDAIANVTLGTGPGVFPGVGFVAAGGVYRQRGNLDAIRSRGIELDGEARHGAWRLGVSAALIDARVRADGTAASLDGRRPAQTPLAQASGSIGWDPGDGREASLTLRHSGRQFEDDQNRRRLASATTLDATARWPVASSLTIELRGENVTNARIEAGITGADIVERATPRTVWIGLRYGRR